jgi:soluble lytic murein transglycosylase-like protein
MRFSLAVAFVALTCPAFAGPVAQDAPSDTAAVSLSARHRAHVDANGNDAGGVYDALVAKHAAANGVPEALVRRVIMRESRYNPRAVSKGNFGIMQIRLGTARALGYSGGAQGLLDADTNMTYAVKYLAGAYKVAGGNHDRAVGLYARGYYFDAKRKGLNAYAIADASPFAPVVETRADAAAERSTGGSAEEGRGREALEDRLAVH